MVVQLQEMAWKAFQRSYTNHKGTFRRQAGILITTTTLAVGLTAAVYEKLTRLKVLAHAQQLGQESGNGRIEIDIEPISTVKPGLRRSRRHHHHEHIANECESKFGNAIDKDTLPNTKWDSNWDKRDPRTLIPPPMTEEEEAQYNDKLRSSQPKATRHLILVRHGVYVHKDIPDKERILTGLGREQAEMTGQYLQNLNLKYTRLISSTLTRAVETADIIHKYLPTLEVEHDAILCEGRPVVPEPWLHWRPPHLYFQQGAMIEAAFRKYFHRADPKENEDSVEVLVCHANVIRYFVCRALQFPPEAWLRIALAHGSITHIMIRPSGHVYLHTLGCTGHMVPGKVTISARGQVLW